MLIPLNLTKKQTADFLTWLALDTYWGHTWCAEYEKDNTKFLINGHTLDTFSNQHHQLVIDGGYIDVRETTTYLISNNEKKTGLEYALNKLGF